MAEKNPSQTSKARYEKWKATENTKRGKLSFNYCNDVDKNELFERINAVKAYMGDGNPNTITTFELLHRVLDFYHLANCVDNKVVESGDFVGGSEYQLATIEDAETEELYIGTMTSLDKLISRTEAHRACCDKPLSVTKHNKMCHAVQITVSCESKHTFTWTSSQNTSSQKLLVNLRMAHGFLSSGILPNQLQKMCSEAKIGQIGEKYLDSLMHAGHYIDTVTELKQQSFEDSVLEEIAAEEFYSESGEDGINILSDARHCWRKNARFSDVVCIGQRTHKVLFAATISKEDDFITQRHELIGVKRIYEYFDNQAVQVKNHAHDNNASVTNYVKTYRWPTENAKDTWHATKGISRDIKKITSGAAYKEGKEWFKDLADKSASIRTHLYWCMKNCKEDAQKLREMMDSIIPHYTGDHSTCHQDSRCKRDNPYIPSKCLITTEAAVTALSKFLHNNVIYKDAASYRFCADTHYVESFNNALLQYHDKRICFGRKVYDLRIALAVLDWNENVDRKATSEKQVLDPFGKNPRRQQPVKVLSAKTNNFKAQIWNTWIKKLCS